MLANAAVAVVAGANGEARHLPLEIAGTLGRDNSHRSGTIINEEDSVIGLRIANAPLNFMPRTVVDINSRLQHEAALAAVEEDEEGRVGARLALLRARKSVERCVGVNAEGGLEGGEDNVVDAQKAPAARLRWILGV